MTQLFLRAWCVSPVPTPVTGTTTPVVLEALVASAGVATASGVLGSQLELLRALVGTWATEGVHPMLPGTVIHGRATFEWLEGGRFLIWRSHYDHPEIPDAIAVTGVTDNQLSMHYFDSRGVYRVYSVSMSPGTWRFSRDAPGFSQRFTGTFSDGGIARIQ
jgi:hypothetical protein